MTLSINYAHDKGRSQTITKQNFAQAFLKERSDQSIDLAQWFMLISVESRSNSARMVDHESPTHLHDAVRVETHSSRPPPQD